MAHLDKVIFRNTPIPIKLTILFSLAFLLQVSNGNFSEDTPCGILYSEPSAENQTRYLFSDQDQSTNLPGDFTVSEDGWNMTDSIHVENGCKMTVCNDTYFDGTCLTFQAGSHAFNSSSNFTDTVLSAQCTCTKQCNCSDVFVKKSSCGRAYLEGGCSTCNSLYVNLNGSSKYFPEEYTEKVQAIKLRKGCTLTVWSDVEFDGDKTIIDRELVEDFRDEIGSYACNCDDQLYVPKVPPPRPESYPEYIDVPSSLDNILKMLGTDAYRNHPGLLAAKESYRNRRSSTNAYILLVGSTGAGKSSAINLLFDNPNVTKVGDITSTTSDIHEFRIPVPIDELGIFNSELRVIDTPGLGDTRGLEQDAKFLATLDNYLSTHVELKDRLPNVVLIFHKFNDNRFGGGGASFVKMIRGLDYFTKRITDENYSNVIFVFSHFCSVPKKEKRRPEGRLNKFKEVIEDFTLYPKPTHLVVAENKPNDNELPMVNGFYKMPNNEYYPKNLFQKLELVTLKGGDMIGLGVFRTAFRDSENFNVSKSTFKLVSTMDGKVERFLSILTNANIGVVNTEISQILDQVWNNNNLVDADLRKKFPFSLPYLQRSLNLRNINSKQDIPRTIPEIVNLLMAIKQDEATRTLLDKGLHIRSPTFPMNTIAGYSYDVFRDIPLPASPFKTGSLQQSDIGFLIQKSLSCKVDQATTQHHAIYTNMEKYLEDRLKSLGVTGTFPIGRYQGKIKPGSNLKEDSFKNNSCTLTATRDFRLFEFVLNDRLEFNEEFERTVKALTVFNDTDHANVEQWKQFFNTYGSHVVKSIYGGGQIQIRLESNKALNPEFAELLLDLVKFAEEMTFFPSDADSDSNMTFARAGTEHTLTFIGGDSAFHTNDLTKMSVADASTILMNWKKSLKFNPAVLTTEMRLEPISFVVRKLGQHQNYSEEIERASRLLFDAKLTFNQEKARADKGPGFDRDSTPMLVGMINTIQLQNDRFHNLTIDMKNEQAKNEKRRLDMEERDQIFRQNQTIIEAKYKNDLANAALHNANEFQKQQDFMETKRMEHEKTMADKQEGFRKAADAARKASEDRYMDMMNSINNSKPKPKKCILWGLACW